MKNGTPPQRKSALRQLTDKARDLGAGPLFNQILPLLMSPTLEDQERHLLVKVRLPSTECGALLLYPCEICQCVQFACVLCFGAHRWRSTPCTACLLKLGSCPLHMSNTIAAAKVMVCSWALS